MKSRSLALAVATACASACTKSSAPTLSTDIPTAQLGMAITARSDGHVTQVIVGYFGGLTAPDRFYARDAGGEVELASLGAGTYVAQFALAPTTVVVGLARAGGVRVETPADLPQPFTVETPTATSRKAPIVLEWDAPAAGAKDTIAIDVTGDCIQPVRRTLASDTGTFTLQPADFFSVGAPRDCVLTAEVRRERRPTAAWSTSPSPLGSITTQQTRVVSFSTTP